MERADVQGAEPRLWALAALGAAAPAAYAGDPDGNDCAQHLSVHHRAQGIFSAAGHGAHGRRAGGAAGYFVQRIARQDGRLREHYPQGSGAREHHQLCRQFDDGQQRGTHVHDLEAAGQARREQRRSDRAAASEAGAGSGRIAVSAVGAGVADRRPHVERAVPVHAAERQPCAAERLGATVAGQDGDLAAVAGGQQRSADTRAGTGCDGGSRCGGAAGREFGDGG